MKVHTEYSWNVIGDQLADIIEGLLEGDPNAHRHLPLEVVTQAVLGEKNLDTPPSVGDNQ